MTAAPIRTIPAGMTASTDAAPRAASQAIIRRYYLAMGVPFLIDLITLGGYAAIFSAPEILLPTMLMSTAFLAGGVGILAHFLIRPVSRFIAGEVSFAEIENALTNLPRHSAAVMAVCYAPMIALRMTARRIDVSFAALPEDPAWLDTISSFFVATGFNVLLAFFVVIAYLDQLCEHLFETRGVNLHIFHGRFRRKIAFALLYVAFAGMILLYALFSKFVPIISIWELKAGLPSRLEPGALAEQELMTTKLDSRSLTPSMEPEPPRS
jgi:hypothetical protein